MGDALTIRVLQFNVHGMRAGTGPVARAIGSHAPDIACLQEVDRPRALARASKMHWAGVHRFGTGHRVGVLSRERPETVERVRLSRTRGLAPRAAALVRWRGVWFASVHLGLDAGERARHVQQLLDHIGARAPLVLAGDWNEHSGTATDLLRARYTEATKDSGPTFPAHAPRVRIDAVYVGEGVVVDEVTVGGYDTASDHRALVIVARI